MNIPMVDLKGQYLTLKDEIDSALIDALSATQFILGPNVQAFEQEAAEYLGVEHAVGVASGTDALHLALAAADIGAGDEVITTPFTFIATAEAISYVGATPVFVDIDPYTFNIDLNQVEQAHHRQNPRGDPGAPVRPAGRHECAEDLCATPTTWSSSRTARSRSVRTSTSA